jgi:hypothetical protein
LSAEPVAQGLLVPVGRRHQAILSTLSREAAAMLRALRAAAAPADAVGADADFVVLLVEAGADARDLALPDLKDRAASVLGFGEDAAEGRVAVAQARKHLRAHGAALGSRELVFTPGHFGHVGMESDAMREKLEILLRTLVLDAERLRLRREGWEEPLE